MLETIFSGISNLGNPVYWMAFAAAVAMAVFVGLVPGVSAVLVMALSIPFIVLNIRDPLIGIVMLATLTGVDNTLDSIPAVLLGQPGASTQVTFLEGNQLARQGKAAYTLGAVYAVSAMGGVIGALVLLLIIPVIKPFILRFGFPEIAAMALFGVAMVAALSAGAMVKGIIAALLGLLLGTVGIDPVNGVHRYTFDQLWLWNGIPLIAATIGFFALPEMIDLTMTRRPVAISGGVVSNREVFRGARYGLSRWRFTVRHSLFGVFLGAVPGVGSAVVDWLSYAMGIFFTKDKREFGKGSLDGVLFAESAQNAKEGGQAIPTLAFGVPGGRAWAFVLVAMIVYGIAPGPQMLDRYADITIMIVVSLALGNLAVTMVGLLATGQLAKLTLIPYPLIGAIIIPISFLSAFQDTTHVSAIYIVLVATVLGLLMKQFRWPRPPLLLGFILGPIIESNLQSALSIHGAVGMMTRPITITLVVLSVVIAVAFSRMTRASGAPIVMEEEALPKDGTLPALGTTPTATQTMPRTSMAHLRDLRPGFNPQSIFTGLLIVLALAFLVQALNYPVRARFFPVLLTSGIITLAVVQLAMESLKVKSGDIMDIGMRSAGMVGARTTGLIVAGLLTMLILLTFTIGLKYASIAFATLGPLLLMEGRAKLIGAAIAFLFVTTFNLVLMDHVIHVIWPEPLIGWFSAN